MVLKIETSRFIVLLVAATCVAVLFSGCGFQPRGRADLSFESIYVETDGFSLFGAELRRVVQAGNVVEVVETADEADVVLKVLSERQERQIISLTATGSVREFQLLYRVAYLKLFF